MDLEREVNKVMLDTWNFRRGRNYTPEEQVIRLLSVFTEATQYHQAEVDYWKQQCEDVEIDLMLEQNKILKFNVATDSINRKRRTNF